MTEEGRRESSREELSAADALLQAGFARVSLARTYFAVFHAARACLYAHDFEPRTHAGVHHLFNLHFVKSARFEPMTARLMARLQKYREEEDYSRAFIVDADGAREELEAAETLGMSLWQTVRYVIAPHIAKTLYAPLSNFYIWIVLGSSMAGIFAVEELTGRAINVSSSTFRTIEVFTYTAGIYVVLTVVASALLALIGRHAFRVKARIF